MRTDGSMGGQGSPRASLNLAAIDPVGILMLTHRGVISVGMLPLGVGRQVREFGLLDYWT